MTKKTLRIALPKGRMMDEALALWGRLGSSVTAADVSSRRLILPSIDGRFEFLPVKSQDVPVYVVAGVADAGVVGFDVLNERRPDVLQPLDLGFGACRVVVAAPEGVEYPHLSGAVTPRVATKYVETTRRFFAQKGLQVEPIRISGSVEIAPLLGLAHWILDLVETGRTLSDNGLQVVDTVCSSTARLIVNRASHKLRLEEHQALIAELESALAGSATEGRRVAS